MRVSGKTLSNLLESLDEHVCAWAERPIKEEYRFPLADTKQLNIRRRKAVRSAKALIVVGISKDGYPKIPGLKIVLR